jgi:ABC-type spermidine/putrescine transport system permease subunit II
VPTVQSSIVATILAQVTFFSATGLLFVSSFKSPRRPLLISAARTMGARSTSIFFGVNLPLRRPAIAGTCALIFALSIDESVFSIFVLSDNVRTVPRYIWNHVGYVNDPSMAAAAIIVLLVLVPFYLVPLGALRWWRREDVSHD